MRQVKFRAKRLDNKEWMYGHLCFDDEEGRYYIPNMVRAYNVNPETIGQLTGVKDVNGKDIWEGDILKNDFSEKPFGFVVWHPDGYFFIYPSSPEFNVHHNDCYRPLGEMIDQIIDGKPCNFKIIGNIYDK